MKPIPKEEIEAILKEYWDKPHEGKSRPKRVHYSEDYIQGFNLCAHNLVERRIINKAILRDALRLE